MRSRELGLSGARAVLQWQANETFCNTGNPSCGPNFVSNWLEAHKEDAASLGKALVVGEFGKQLGGAEPYFRVVYDSYSNSTARGENLRGTEAHPFVCSSRLAIIPTNIG